MTLYMNKESGELLTFSEMVEQAAEQYDMDDPTNGCKLDEYYERVQVDVTEEQLEKLTQYM